MVTAEKQAGTGGSLAVGRGWGQAKLGCSKHPLVFGTVRVVMVQGAIGTPWTLLNYQFLFDGAHRDGVAAISC